jgi:hypothetical protein
MKNKNKKDIVGRSSARKDQPLCKLPVQHDGKGILVAQRTLRANTVTPIGAVVPS